MTSSTMHKVLMAAAATALGALVWAGGWAATGHAATPDSLSPVAEADDSVARVERGKIVGWSGGDAVIYPTFGFFGAAQIFVVGAIAADGSFAVTLPAVVPVDLLTKSTDQCSTIQSSDPDALSNFTGNYLIFQHGQQIGATHSASSLAFASFTGFADGDTRTGLFYANHDVTLGGFCERQLAFGAAHIDFLQKFAIQAHRGWNEVVAVLSIPQPGHVVASLTAGSNRAGEQWFFFLSSPQPGV
ncbi:MAG TPA: hypothetical protein VKV73_23595 [Chloroflexota bacterium]|nr:hypothetical protein [Chloroflexota bacterium]